MRFSNKPDENNPSIHLDGRSVYVRFPKPGDWSAWAQRRSYNQDDLKPLEPVWPEGALTKDFFHRRLQRQYNNWRNDKGCSLLIFMKENDNLIGGININHITRGASQFASLGYWLDKDHQGHGYMTEALKLVIEFSFTELKLHRLNAGCLLDNDKSVNLLKRCGFTEEGIAKKYLKINNLWQDHRLFGLNIEDWEN